MAENKMAQVAAMFGKKLGERFVIEYDRHVMTCMFDDHGLVLFMDTTFTAEYIEARMLEALLCGEAKIIDWPAVP